MHVTTLPHTTSTRRYGTPHHNHIAERIITEFNDTMPIRYHRLHRETAAPQSQYVARQCGSLPNRAITLLNLPEPSQTLPAPNRTTVHFTYTEQNYSALHPHRTEQDPTELFHTVPLHYNARHMAGTASICISKSDIGCRVPTACFRGTHFVPSDIAEASAIDSRYLRPGSLHVTTHV